jgi:ribosomal-protein-alanine N-acetyltransferase
MFVLLETKRLMLRPLKAADIGRFLPLIADFEVAKNLATVTHPYTEDDACAFVTRNAHGWTGGNDCGFAVLRKQDGSFIGMCGVHPQRDWEFGYWVGKPHWDKGYATEAGARVVAFAFGELFADQLKAGWYVDNPASGRVLEKLGFTPAGTAEQACLARGCTVTCNRVVLDRATYMTRKMGMTRKMVP